MKIKTICCLVPALAAASLLISGCSSTVTTKTSSPAPAPEGKDYKGTAPRPNSTGPREGQQSSQ